MSDDVAIRMRAVEKGFGPAKGRTQALRGVDLEVRTGELVMLSGPSGCGKTTLISIMAGIMDADAGTCHAFGCDIASMSEAWRSDFRRHRVGFVFQSFHLLPCLSVVENVAVPLQLLGISPREAREMAADTLAQVGLSAQRNASPSLLSGGQQQRVAIARAVVHRPMLVICDEPTSALDHENGRLVMGLLRELAVADGRSVVVVTHDPRILPFADAIARMDDGRILEMRRGRDRQQQAWQRETAPGGPSQHTGVLGFSARGSGEGHALRHTTAPEAAEDAALVVILDGHDDEEQLHPAPPQTLPTPQLQPTQVAQASRLPRMTTTAHP